MLLSVTGTAAQIQQALHTNLRYRSRMDGSTFVTVDREPSVDVAVTLLRISGLNDAIPPRPNYAVMNSVEPTRGTLASSLAQDSAICLAATISGMPMHRE